MHNEIKKIESIPCQLADSQIQININMFAKGKQ